MSFMFLFFIALLAVGFPMLFINMNWGLTDETNIVTALITDAFFGNYKIALGEFPLDDWNDDDTFGLAMMGVLFVLATFFSQITLLNMLIAIMGDTFGTVYAKKQSNSMRMKVQFISEFEKTIINTYMSEKMHYMFIIKPIAAASDEDNKIAEIFETQVASINSRIRGAENELSGFKETFLNHFDILEAKLNKQDAKL